MDIKALLDKMTVKEKAYQLLQLNTLAYSVDKGVVKITGPVAQDEIDKDYIFEAGSALNSVGAQRMIDIQSNYLKNSNNKIPLVITVFKVV